MFAVHLMSLNAISDYVQQHADLIKIVSGYLPLEPGQKAFKSNCPFHYDQNKSLMISPAKNIFRCFGCGKDGGPVEFLMAMEGKSKEEAIQILAHQLGLPQTR
jgi:DNA primase